MINGRAAPNAYPHAASNLTCVLVLMGLAFVVLFSALLAELAAQDLDAGPRLVEIVAPEQRITRRILLVVDTSDSMKRGGRFARAMGAVAMITGQPVDELEVGVIAFAETHARWPGVPGGDARWGWAALPSEEAVEEAVGWLETVDVGSTTSLGPALETALREPVEELSVIVVSDGVIDNAGALRGHFGVGQAVRATQGRDRALVACYGVGSTRSVALRELAEWGGGGYWIEERQDADRGEIHGANKR